MSHVASLELCKELYELSGWKTGRFFWSEKTPKFSRGAFIEGVSISAYDLGYLLEKLPAQITLTKGVSYACRWVAEDRNNSHNFTGKTPEDAACKLAIELFKQGILEPINQ